MHRLRVRYENGVFYPLDTLPELEDGQELTIRYDLQLPDDPLVLDVEVPEQERRMLSLRRPGNLPRLLILPDASGQ